MRLLLLHPHDVHYFPWTIRIIKIAESLAKRGHEVTLVHPSLPQWELEVFPRKVIFEVPENAPYRVVRLKERQRHLVANLRTVVALAKGVDLIHVQKCYPNVVVPALMAAWRWNLPVHYDWDDYEEAIVIRVHGIARGFGRLTRFYERRLPRYVNTISASSLEIRNMAVERGASPESIVDAPVGADLEVYRPDLDGSAIRHSPEFGIGDAPLAVYLGQLEGSAYAELFIKAAERVRSVHPEARFLLVGGGVLLKRLRRMAKERGLDSVLHLTGYVNRENVPEYLAAADVAVACFEDNEITRCKSPLKIAEYMAAGRAIVASNVGEVPRMLGHSGFLAKPGDSESLASGMIRYFEDANLRKRHGREVRKRAESTYNWERTTDNIEKAYLMAVSER